jgi:hypothetical protein
VTARRRSLRLVAAAGLVLVAPVLPAVGAESDDDRPVDDAREAARRVPFSARVEVSWADKSGFHTAEVGVRAVGGRITVQGVGDDGEDDRATVVEDNGDAGGLLAPAVEREYDLVRRKGPVVAGRPTELVLLRRDGELRERLAIDEATGLLLLREVFDAGGRRVRVVRVLQLDTAPLPAPSSSATRRADGPSPLRVSSLSSRYRAPDSLAGGYQRVAAYRHSRAVHLLYTDGLHGLSLFSQPGTLSTGELPRGGEPVRVGTAAGVHYTWAGGEVITWEAGSMVHTLVGDGPAADLLAAARSVPRPGRASVLDRVRATSRLVAELISGGR